jgi:pantothenate synthetase
MADVKKLINQWNLVWKEQVAETKRNRAKMIVENGNLIFFFTCRNDLFGAGESSRVTYAKMIDPKDEDNTEGWLKEANFTGLNLYKCVNGEQAETIFGEKDLKQIDIITDRKKVEDMLIKHIDKG